MLREYLVTRVRVVTITAIPRLVFFCVLKKAGRVCIRKTTEILCFWRRYKMTD